MLKAYVDESYSSEFYYIAAAIGDQQCWDAVALGFDQIRQQTALLHGTSNGIEIHGHEIMGGVGDWAPLRGRHREAAGVYSSALRVCKNAGVKFILRGLDVDALNRRYKYPQQPHSVVFSHLLERIDDHAKAVGEPDPVTVIADEISTKQEHIAQFDAYQTYGTPGYRKTRLPRIAAPVTFAPSHLHDGLQAVDLAAYLHRRREAGPERFTAAARARQRMCKLLDAGVVHNWTWYP